MVSEDTPLRPKDVCDTYFGGVVKVATLMAEHSRGNLEIFKIGRTYFTTLAKIKEMEVRCLVSPPRQLAAKSEPRRRYTVEAEAEMARAAAQEAFKRLGKAARARKR